jgi:hypothetical protein
MAVFNENLGQGRAAFAGAPGNELRMMIDESVKQVGAKR